jgi:hypothetical protein
MIFKSRLAFIDEKWDNFESGESFEACRCLERQELKGNN